MPGTHHARPASCPRVPTRAGVTGAVGGGAHVGLPEHRVKTGSGTPQCGEHRSPSTRGELGGLCEQERALWVLRVASSPGISCCPQDSVSALLEQTAVELEAVEKKLEESRSTLTSGESW